MRIRRCVSALLLLGLPACTVLPERGIPLHEDAEVVVNYDIDPHGDSWVIAPASDDDVTVLWLRADPTWERETFIAGSRRLHFDPGALTIRCRYRAWARDGVVPDPVALFPGATQVRTLWRRRGDGTWRP